jgi:hypothetical protein
MHKICLPFETIINLPAVLLGSLDVALLDRNNPAFYSIVYLHCFIDKTFTALTGNLNFTILPSGHVGGEELGFDAHVPFAFRGKYLNLSPIYYSEDTTLTFEECLKR